MCINCAAEDYCFYFLKVPFSQKDEAKAMGAKWNPDKKRWYINKTSKNCHEIFKKFK